MKKISLFLLILCSLCLFSCKERFSEGERVGTVTKFSKAGVIWDSWDGHLNLTQTGMNSAGEPFAFSFDNDRHDQDSLISIVEDAQRYGWKIKLIYHQVWGLKNVWQNRGETDYFVDGVEVLDKNFAKPLSGLGTGISSTAVAIDTCCNDTNRQEIAPLGSAKNPIHIVIDKKK